MTRPKLNKWYTIRTRFKVVPAHIETGERRDLAKSYRLIIEFPTKHRKGWFPFELQLKNGPSSWTNYWCNPFGVDEIEAVIEAVNSIHINQRNLARLHIVEYRHQGRMYQMRKANMPKDLSKYIADERKRRQKK